MRYWKAYLWAALILASSCRPLKIVESSSEAVPINDKFPVSEEITAVYQPYKEQIEEQMEEEVVRCAGELRKDKPESSLGNHAADVTLWCAEEYYPGNVDLALVNYGGIRVPVLDEGPLVVRDAYQLMPFDNYIVVLELDADLMRKLFDFMAYNGGWPITGATYIISDGKAQDVRIGGEAVKDGRKYAVALTDYLANGGDQMDFLRGVEQFNTNVLFRDAIIGYWRKLAAEGKAVTPVTDGRVRFDE